MKPIEVMVSAPAKRLLRDLVAKGLYGQTEEEVAVRLIEQALQTFVEKPQLELISARRGPSELRAGIHR